MIMFHKNDKIKLKPNNTRLNEQTRSDMNEKKILLLGSFYNETPINQLDGKSNRNFPLVNAKITYSKDAF